MPGVLDDLLARYGETLSIEECAELLRKSPQTVSRRLRRGEIPGYKVGDGWVIPTAGLRELLWAGANAAAQALERGEPLTALQDLEPLPDGED